MPQTNLSYIEVFHRNNYPASAGRVPYGDIIETISIILDHKFTEIENKSQSFFSVKPRRLEFGVRTSDTSLFDSQLDAHPNYPNLSDYMIRGFDNSDIQVFEGIISVENTYTENKGSVSLTAYDPIVLFSDSDFRLSAGNLEANYKDPYDFQERIFDAAISQYFTAVGNTPDYDKTPAWTIPDWGLGDFKDLYDWEDLITDFYSDVKGDVYDLAKTELGVVTNVYDYSKIEINRGGKEWETIFARSVVFSFTGLVVYENASGEKFIVYFFNGGYYTRISYSGNNITSPLPNNMTSYTYYYESKDGYVDDYTHNLGNWWTSYSALKYSIPLNTSVYFQDQEVDIFSLIKFYRDEYGYGGVDILDKDLKSQVHAKYLPQWRSLASGENYREAFKSTVANSAYNTGDNVGLAISYHTERGNYLKNTYGLEDEGGNLIENEGYDQIEELDYLYSEYYKVIYAGYTSDTDIVPSYIYENPDFEDGIFDLSSNIYYDNMYKWTPYKFHVNYNTVYPLVSTSFPKVAGGYAEFEAIGNIGKIIGNLPSDVTYALLSGSTDYVFEVTEQTTYYKLNVLLKFLLASMNLYCYYDGANSNYKLIPTFTYLGTPTVIADDDIINWQTQTQKKVYIDASDALSPTLNYTGNSLNPEYNKIAALDVKRATCKISRCPLTVLVDYGLYVNKAIKAKSENWRIESINPFEAYYELTLTKYISDPL